MIRDIFILGTSGHATDVAEVAFAAGYRPVLVARSREDALAWQGSDEVVIEDEAILARTADFAIGIGDPRSRAEVAGRLRSSVKFPSLIHPDTSFGRSQRERVEQSSGTIVFAGVRTTSRMAIGDFCILNLNATISHDCDLGDFVTVSPGANVAGNVTIGDGAWIGAGAVVNQGLPGSKRMIGAWTMIGSGAVVTSDCDAESTYAGVPARKMK